MRTAEVLVVDDKEGMREGCREVLGARGHSVDVADAGRGIPEAELPMLFGEFHRVKTKENEGTTGTGLGLSIVKRVVEAHHGQVRVRSKHGEGSVFSVWLPGVNLTPSPLPHGGRGSRPVHPVRPRYPSVRSVEC